MRGPLGRCYLEKHMQCARGIILGTLTLVITQSGFAQGPGPSLLWQHPSVLATSLDPGAPSYKVRAPDHRWEGVAIGAGVGAIAFGLLGAVACGQSDSDSNCTGIVLGTGLLGAFCGGIVGGLIGGSIPKAESADSTS
jgi:hypothetical protein